MRSLGERIKFIQKASGKNQADFAKILGISKKCLLSYTKKISAVLI